MYNSTLQSAIQLVASLIVKDKPALRNDVNGLLAAFGQPVVPSPVVTPATQTKETSVKGRVYVESSNINFVEFKAGRRYDARRPGLKRTKNVVTVGFHNGSVYSYSGVPASLFNQLVEAESVGGFFNESIKGEYPSTKLQDAQSSAM